MVGTWRRYKSAYAREHYVTAAMPDKFIAACKYQFELNKTGAVTNPRRKCVKCSIALMHN